MPIHAFRMNLHKGQEAEYWRRHQTLWPELAAALEEAGIEDYRIFLDHETCHLFAIMFSREDHHVDALSDLPVMRRWWEYMADIMETYENHAPVSVPLDQVFAFHPGEL